LIGLGSGDPSALCVLLMYFIASKRTAKTTWLQWKYQDSPVYLFKEERDTIFKQSA